MPKLVNGKSVPIKFNYEAVCTTRIDEISQYLEEVFNESNMSLRERRTWIEDLVEHANIINHEFACNTPHMNLLAVAVWLLQKRENLTTFDV